MGESKRKGMTKFYLNEAEEKEFLNYTPLRPKLISWDELTASKTFAVKSYKDSVYRGEIVESMRHGRGVITYNSSRLYEG